VAQLTISNFHITFLTCHNVAEKVSSRFNAGEVFSTSKSEVNFFAQVIVWLQLVAT